MVWGGRGAILLCDVATYVDMTFIPFTEEETHVSRLALIVWNGSEPSDAGFTTHRLEYVAFLRLMLHLIY